MSNIHDKLDLNTVEKKITRVQKNVGHLYNQLLRKLDGLAKLCDKDDRPQMAAKYRADMEAIRKIYVTHF
jgi:hypothetical protein